MDFQQKKILWAAIKQQNELLEVALGLGETGIAGVAQIEVLRLAERLKNGVSNTGFDNSTTGTGEE